MEDPYGIDWRNELNKKKRMDLYKQWMFCHFANPAYKDADQPLKLIKQFTGNASGESYLAWLFGKIKYPTQAEEQETPVGLVMPQEMGLSGRLTCEEVYTLFSAWGFYKLPQTKIAMLVNMEHKKIKDSISGIDGRERIYTYMEPIKYDDDFGNNWMVLAVQRNAVGDLEVHSACAEPECEFFGAQRWFVGLGDI